MTGLVPNVWAAIIIPIPAATLALILRLKARRMTRMGMGYDDGLSILAWIFAVSYSASLILWASRYKLGQKLESYDDRRIDFYLEKSRLILWISEFLYAWSIFFSKLAVLTFYRRLFQLSSIRIPIIICMVACILWIILRTFFTIFHCIPVQAFWNTAISNARCLTNIAKFYLGTDLTHCLMDFIILALPIFEVTRIKLPAGQTVAVAGLFASGSLVGIASIFQIVASQKYRPGTRELPYELALSLVWGNVEVHLAVFASSLILLRPIFRKFIPGLSSGNSYATSRPSVAFQASTSYRNVPRRATEASTEETPHSTVTRELTHGGCNAIDLAGSKEDVSRSLRGWVNHEEYHMSGLPGRQGILPAPGNVVPVD
ncbi:hypothetical protein B0T10DRAFT_586338 [Thelonectria olida]|uniref:Rhodopsin domain-containing protein n=1 Tax=Thelonectria olida TaxID=1576542 RepID=A0A9P8VTE3_9HYPO|nr:hypothetical protein B0T10DRAFT_586338 [Thelonectria olida]